MVKRLLRAADLAAAGFIGALSSAFSEDWRSKMTAMPEPYWLQIQKNELLKKIHNAWNSWSTQTLSEKKNL